MRRAAIAIHINFPILLAIGRASFFVSSLAADRRLGSSSKLDIAQRLTVSVADDETFGVVSTHQGGGKRGSQRDGYMPSGPPPL